MVTAEDTGRPTCAAAALPASMLDTKFRRSTGILVLLRNQLIVFSSSWGCLSWNEALSSPEYLSGTFRRYRCASCFNQRKQHQERRRGNDSMKQVWKHVD